MILTIKSSIKQYYKDNKKYPDIILLGNNEIELLQKEMDVSVEKYEEYKTNNNDILYKIQGVYIINLGKDNYFKAVDKETYYDYLYRLRQFYLDSLSEKSYILNDYYEYCYNLINDRICKLLDLFEPF